MKKRFIEIAVKVIVAALTAFLTAITTTSCMGYGPLYGPLPKIVKISQMKNPLAVAGGFSLKNYTVGTDPTVYYKLYSTLPLGFILTWRL